MYYRERVQIKISQWKSLRRIQNRQHEPPDLLSQGTHVGQSFPLPAAHTEEALSSLGAQGVYWDLVRSAWLTTCGPDLSLSRSRCQGPHHESRYENHTTWRDPRPPTKQDPLTWQEFPSWRGYLPAACESRAFLWARLTLSWKILFLSRASSVWEQKYNKLPNISLFGHMPVEAPTPDTWWERTD